jgi:peptide/nickel transport system substrate-binding protein
MTRNPFYHAVDPAGNQLPYIDRIVIQEVNQEVYQLKASGGEADIAYGGLTTENIPLYKSSEASGDFKTVLIPGTMSSAWTLNINPTYDEPGSANRKTMNNVKFRQALSVAIDRNELNEILAFGLGEPSAATVLPETSFYQEGWKEYYSQYDPALANRLLDEIGLDKKDKDSYRIGLDGKTFQMLIEYTDQRHDAFLELVKEYWEAVGIKTIIKLEEGGLHEQRMHAGQIQIWPHNNPNIPPSAERFAFMSLWQWGGPGVKATVPEVAHWDREKGDAVREITGEKVLPENWTYFDTPEFDKEWTEERGAEIPQDWWKDQILRQNKWRVAEMGTPEYEETGREIFEVWTKMLGWIGTVGRLPQAMIVKNGLKNTIVPGWVNGVAMGAFLVQRWSAPQLWWDREDRR